jgi:dihydrofolate reductase
MNAVPKLVASRAITDVSAWANSEVIDGDVMDAVKRQPRDVIIAGSLSIVHAVADLVDEYRLLIFPTVLGVGQRLFRPDRPVHFTTVSAEQSGTAVFATYTR